jgi:hypothetical protein
VHGELGSHRAAGVASISAHFFKNPWEKSGRLRTDFCPEGGHSAEGCLKFALIVAALSAVLLA